MKTYDEMEYHPNTEKLVKIMCRATRTDNPLFFRVLIGYYFSVVAATMRAKIRTVEGDVLPVNTYAIGLMPSGMGKGRSTNIMENDVLAPFIEKFKAQTEPLLAKQNIPILAQERALRKQADPDDELIKTTTEYESTGDMYFFIDKGTEAALKQYRHKLLMLNAGSLNLQIDEIGKNLLGAQESLDVFLELYDTGKIKPSLTKNTRENIRLEEIIGSTPTNAMLFGAPCALLNGSKIEEEFYAMLETGMARRCFFGYAKAANKRKKQTPQERLDEVTSHQRDTFLDDLGDEMENLADPAYLGRTLGIDKKVGLIFITYQLNNEELADELSDHDELRRLELMHRHFKAMKLAGALAFVDSAPEITEAHAYYAIKLAEDSGKAFDSLLTRDRTHVKLAKYIAETRRPVTQVDLVEDLPFYKGNASQKADMMRLAIAYGYQNNIIIKKTFTDEVEFLSGETLKPASLDEIMVSYSQDIAKNYVTETAKFEDLHKMTQMAGFHWCNHAFADGHRCEDKAIPGFNILVLDCDGTIALATAKDLLKDYKAMFYTTKRHGQNGQDRFRIILPINFELELDAKDYKEFWENVYAWLPFDVDHASSQRARKWMSHNGSYSYQDGDVLDILPFIPKTSKNESFKEKVLDQAGMDNLERWVMNNSGDGNRNNMLLRFAMILVDGGFDFNDINQKVNDLNSNFATPLDAVELLGTVMQTVSKALAKRP